MFWGVLRQHFGAFWTVFWENIFWCFWVFKGGIWGHLGAFKVFFNVLFGVLEHFRLAFWSFRAFWGILVCFRRTFWCIPGQHFEVFWGLSESLGTL